MYGVMVVTETGMYGVMVDTETGIYGVMVVTETGIYGVMMGAPLTYVKRVVADTAVDAVIVSSRVSSTHVTARHRPRQRVVAVLAGI